MKTKPSLFLYKYISCLITIMSTLITAIHYMSLEGKETITTSITIPGDHRPIFHIVNLWADWKMHQGWFLLLFAARRKIMTLVIK